MTSKRHPWTLIREQFATPRYVSPRRRAAAPSPEAGPAIGSPPARNRARLIPLLPTVPPHVSVRDTPTLPSHDPSGRRPMVYAVALIIK